MAYKQIIGKQEKEAYFGRNLSQSLFWRGSGRSSKLVHWAEYLNTRKKRCICLPVVCSSGLGNVYVNTPLKFEGLS